MNKLEKFISFRYLFSAKRSQSVSFITRISIIGVTIGVMTLIVVLSVMNGFENDLKKALIGTNAHLTLTALSRGGEQKIDYSQQFLENLRESITAEHITPYSLNQALLGFQNKPHGILMKGIDPKIEIKAQQISFLIRKNLRKNSETKTNAEQHLIEVTEILDNLKLKPRIINKKKENLAGIIVGAALAKSLSLNLGDSLTILSSQQKISPFGQIPQRRKFIVVGFFESGLSTYDEVFTLIDLAEAQKTFKLGNQIKGYSIYLPKLDETTKVQESLRQQYPFPYLVTSWIDDNYNVFVVLKLEKIGLAVILFLIILVASFNIISSLIILVSEKAKDIAILKAMGVTNRSIRNIFMLQGAIVGFVGSGLGTLLGLLICLFLANFSVLKLPQGVYVTDRIPILIDWSQIILILAAAFLSCFLVTIFPSRRAAKQNTVTGLRYE